MISLKILVMKWMDLCYKLEYMKDKKTRALMI